MGHYDKQYEETEREQREVQVKRQANCQHRWVPLECDNEGRTTVMKCANCHKQTILG